MWIFKIDLFSPGNDKNKTEDSIIKIVDFESLDDKLCLKIFTINDSVNKTENDCLIDFDNSGEKKQSSSGNDCSKLEHL